jgi:predicted RecA/RadA family phage recombinase
MSFILKDTEIYDELWDITPATAISKGDPAVVNDVFGFYIKDRESAGEEVAFIYRARQVLADKVTGTGEDIQAGEDVYYIVAQDAVSANPVGVAGTDYYWCGVAKKTATASASTVLIMFDGTRYNENI